MILRHDTSFCSKCIFASAIDPEHSRKLDINHRLVAFDCAASIRTPSLPSVIASCSPRCIWRQQDVGDHRRPRSNPSGYSVCTNGVMLAGVERQSQAPTLEQLRRGHPWCWVVCERCLHPRGVHPAYHPGVRTPQAIYYGARHAASSAAAKAQACSIRAGSMTRLGGSRFRGGDKHEPYGPLYPRDRSDTHPLRRSSALVESEMGAVAWGQWPSPRFPSLLIEP
jgi:hypothetical protein